MQYVRETFVYLKRTWWILALVCLPAAVTLGFFIRPVASLTYIPLYVLTDVQNLLDILWLFSESLVPVTLFPGILIFLILVLTFCGMLSIIEKHFRTGRIMIKKSFSEINNYFLSVLKVLLIVGGILVIFFALMMSLTGLQHLIISGAGVPNIGSVIVASVLSLALFATLLWLCSPFMFMIPLMQIYGYTFGDAFTSSISYYGNRPLQIVGGLLSAFLAVAVVGIIINSFSLYIPSFVQTLIWIILHLFLLVFVGAYCMVTTFAITGMERKDQKKYF